MIKLIIADDEPHFRRYMEHVLDWEALGFVVKGIYKNSEEVLEAIPLVRPDLALLDINMPGMDGIALTEKMKKSYPDIIIVFVTGHSEFEYARQAIRLGVDEYLLKPFSKEELAGILEKVKTKKRKYQESKKQHKMDQKIVKEELLKRWMHDREHQDEQAFLRGLGRVHIIFDKRWFLVSVIELDDIINMRKKGEDIGLWKFAVGNIAEEVLREHGLVPIFFYDYEDRVTVILNYDSRKENEALNQDIYKKILYEIERHMGFTASIGMGIKEHSLRGIKDSYQKAISALEGKFLKGGNRFFSYEEMERRNSRHYFYRLDLNDRLLTKLRRKDADGIRNILKQTKSKIFEYQISADHAYMIVSGMLSICLSYVTEMNGKIEEVFGKSFKPYSSIHHMSSLEDTFGFLEKVFMKAIEAFPDNFSKRGNEILKQVESFIDQHFMEMELSVEDIAAGVFLDSSYLRRIVSRQAGCTISDLITRARMKAAAGLIKDGELTIAEISEQVGYNEPGYFGKCFKKFYGVTPRQYGK